MKYIYSLFFLSVIMFSCFNANAAENVVSCNGCSDAQLETAAKEWAFRNLDIQDSSKKSAVVSVIDTSNVIAKSFTVELKYKRAPVGYPPVIDAFISYNPLPAIVSTKMKRLNTSLKQLADDANSTVIPTSVIPDAWTFLECQACKYNVRDYLNETLEYRIRTAREVILDIAESFKVPMSQWDKPIEVPLESGGFVVIKFGIINLEKITIEILEVVDENNNVVPRTAKQLKNKMFYVPTLEANQKINVVIVKYFFTLPVRTGYVNVVECLPGDHDPCK